MKDTREYRGLEIRSVIAGLLEKRLENIKKKRINKKEDNIKEIYSNVIMFKETLLEAAEKVCEKQKYGEAAEEDCIALEIMKRLNIKGKEVILKVMNLETRKISEDWKISVTIPLIKKDDNRECTNHKGIFLLSVPEKLCSRILKKKLMEQMENTLAEPECDYRPNRSTQNPISTLRHIIERNIEYGKKLCFCLINLKKAFDGVP
ncbi:hypothetical protein ILUMI_13316 [Ignelater luminosus]|uniref:Reverse transcriptase domain-containing protein n=1 Tax=Ignelater luminosus TaxID=2038154 RepID=A0A8K0CWX8_IGNLU|nr:hypothetical protein ILUMI_13316 [Ignelater luminosus]